jgi:predicted  nucleic acid-binding Zn-ribbon protein
MELIVETSQGKASQVETKLYGGTVRNPRELEDLQTELNMLREHQRQQEESLLQALEALEETEKALNDLEHNLHEIEATRQKDEKRLVEEMTHLRQEVALLEGKRQSLSALVSPAHLQLYGTLRSSRHGQAVVKVERGMCQGCRIGLPTRTVQLARTSANPVQCPSCNRILYVS